MHFLRLMLQEVVDLSLAVLAWLAPYLAGTAAVAAILGLATYELRARHLDLREEWVSRDERR